MGILDGKVAVVTGSTRGLGLGIAQAFAAEGASVMLASRTQQSVDTAVQQFKAAGRNAAGRVIDVGSLEQMNELVQATLQQYGRLDIWVNNAGVAGPYGPTLGFAPETFYQVVQTNILGVYNGTHAVMRHFLAQRNGKLINMLGRGYQGPVAWQNAYGASKAWVRSFTLALAEETKGSGVGVYAFNPGMVLTDLLTDVDVIEGSQHLLKQFPKVVRMWAKPPEFPARKAAWLASPATDGKTGLMVSCFSPWVLVSGALKEGWRSLLKRPTPPTPVRMHSLPPTN